MSEFRKPEPTDKMDDHAEQHSHAFDEISNLKDYVNPLVEKVETNEDRINSLEAELEAVAETKSAGEWRLVSTVAQAGDMSLSDNNLTNANNALTLHQTDLNNVSHGFSGVEVGDLVEVLEEHEVMSRSTGDYGLYKVTGVNGQTFTLELQQGRGIADLNKRFYVKFFYLSEEIDIAELDARYAQKSHYHNYAPDTHVHSSYASSNHTHSSVPSHSHSYASTSHTHAVKFSSGTSTNPSLSRGEPYLNTSLKVVYVGL